MSAAALHADDELRELYRELIIDHARNPRNFGQLVAATHAARGVNPLCGDELQLFLSIDSEEHIVDVSFQGTGCAISMASASLLSESVIGLRASDALRLFATVAAHLTGDNASVSGDFDLGKIRALYGVREFPARIRCALLSWHALDAALRKQSAPVTTE